MAFASFFLIGLTFFIEAVIAPSHNDHHHHLEPHHLPQRKFSCNEIPLVEHIALAEHVRHPNASQCDPHSGGYDDAIILASCNVTSSTTWRKGNQVIQDCAPGHIHSIPGFTPITTFEHLRYVPLGAKSGIFLECYKNGFKMAIQRCNNVPEIIHVDNSSSIAESFSVIV